MQYPLDRFREGNDGSYRATMVDDYRISFRVKPDQIQIIRIWHGSRKPRFYKR
ncbi:type II toxin-antitoxin system RelE/ParE family toxin [Parapedobacter flavus]|uniref:type II toxin-antitoxin system RelE/ParE family toxin n=1 Tax=Parapedobacter flavus TaxID=3110225 RepID=UPI003F514793